ncbi:hypothetical protein U1Q18_048011, partial [Sarracenia purpurea var. burkii]
VVSEGGPSGPVTKVGHRAPKSVKGTFGLDALERDASKKDQEVMEERKSLKNELAWLNSNAQQSAEAYRLVVEDKKHLVTKLKGQQEWNGVLDGTCGPGSILR